MKNIELTQSASDALVRTICDKFERYSEARAAQLDDIQAIRTAIYDTGSKNRSRARFAIPDIWELAQTLKSHLLENLCSTPESMFDVSGTSVEAQKAANTQKAALVNCFERMNIQDELEKIIDSVVETGEATVLVGWETKTRAVRRLDDSLLETGEEINPTSDVLKYDIPQQVESSKSAFVIEEKTVFDGPRVKFIPAEDFVFDPERLNSFDSAAKIYRTYATISEIRSNRLYSLLDERKLYELTNMTNRTSDVLKYDISQPVDSSKGSKGEQIELLEYWGDVSIDGELYENMLVLVAGRKEILRLEQNPFITQPFVHASIITDPRTSRGVSPLKIALGLSEISSNILNKQLDALSLIINPPYLAPRGCFKGEQAVSPGKIIEYDAALMPNQPVPLNFSAALQGWDFINFFKTSIESATGIYKTMAGNLSAGMRTATEINYSASGQSARLNMFIDAISRKIIIPIVEKTAQTLANFKLGDEQIAVKNNGNVEFITVSDSVRTGDYVYCYGDRRATLERKYRFKELFDIISQFAQRGDFVQNIDLAACFKFALEQYGIENPSKFLQAASSGPSSS